MEPATQLRVAWQRLVDHDCLACTPGAPEACPEYVARNMAVERAAEQVGWWWQWWVFHSLRAPRQGRRSRMRRWG